MVKLLPQLPGGHPQHTGAEAGKLDERIGTGNPNRIVPADFCRQRFNIGVTGFPFPGENHLNIMKMPFFTGITRNLIAIKN